MLDITTSDSTVARNRLAQEGGRAERPELAPGVELLGEMPGTGFQDRQWLAERNGQYLQLTEMLYRICEHCDGRRSVEEIADGVSNSTAWLLEPRTAQLLIDKKLAPLGLVLTDSSSVQPIAESARSPLNVQLRTRVLGPNLIGPVTNLLQFLFAPIVLAPMLALIVVAHIWLYLVHGISASLLEVVRTPGALLFLLPIMFAGLGFHELGHASALRYGGGMARAMGVGLYLVFPVFFTDTTEAYRLPRTARVRTDLGGFYFHAIFALALMAVYALTLREFLLLPVLLIDLDIVYQCLPFVRLDGYWALADITGVPDFFSLMGPFVASLSPARGAASTKLPPLRPFARGIFLLYTLLIVPALAIVGILALSRVPWVFTLTLNAESLQQAAFSQAVAAGDTLLASLSLVQMLLLLVPAAGTLYLLFNLGSAVVNLALRRATGSAQSIGRGSS